MFVPAVQATPNTLTPEQCQALVASDMQKVDQLIHDRLASDVVLINQMSQYIVGSGGKRLRPQLVLLSAQACGYTGEHHYILAAIIEFIHTATLLHDDVVDASELRRGNDTANSVWGNEAAVLVGDFLYSRAFEMMVEVDDLAIMDVLSRTTNRIAEGEVMQLLNVHEPDITEADYINVIEAKTARLFEAATQLGAVLAKQPEGIERDLAAYGRYLGTAFQIVDDVLDYRSDSEAMGKNTGDDLAEGKTTLPLIYAMRDGSPEQAAQIAEAIRSGGLDAMSEVLTIIQATDSLEKSMQRARLAADQADAALAGLPNGEYRDALAAIAHYSVDRIT